MEPLLGEHVDVAAAGHHNGRVAPAPVAAQPCRQPGGQRDRSPPIECHDVPGGRAIGGYRNVASEQARPVTAQPQGARGDQQLGGCALVDRGEPSVVDAGQQFAAHLIVDRAPVIRVDQRCLPQLTALIHVGDSRHGQLQQFERERITPACLLQFRDQADDEVVGRPGTHDGGDKPIEFRLKISVLLGPGGRRSGLARRFERVGEEALAAGWPGADDRLPEQVLKRRVIKRMAPPQLLEHGPPASGDLSEHRDARPHVFATFRIVG